MPTHGLIDELIREKLGNVGKYDIPKVVNFQKFDVNSYKTADFSGMVYLSGVSIVIIL